MEEARIDECIGGLGPASRIPYGLGALAKALPS